MSDSIFDKLSLGAKNSTVTAFKNLVDDKVDSVKNISNAVKTTADNVINTGKSTINTIKKNGLTGIANSVTSVKNSITGTIDSVKNLTSDLENEYKKFKQTTESVVTEFDFDLYAKVLKLPECQNVSFDYATGIASNLIGTFTGNKVFKDFEGNIKTTINGAISQANSYISQASNTISQISSQSGNIVSQLSGQVGKIILDPSSPEYALFTNNDITEIIALKDFNSESLISDFSDLYQNLLNSKFGRLENYIGDIRSAGSLFASFSEYTADDIIGVLPEQISSFAGDITNNVSNLWNSVSSDIYSNIDNFKSLIIPESSKSTLPIPDSASKLISGITTDNSVIGTASEIAKGVSNLTGKDSSSATNNIDPAKVTTSAHDVLLNKSNITNSNNKSVYDLRQAYEEIDTAQVQATINYDGLTNTLLCWQQPESISYSASAQFDGVPSRGTQQPFQFYNCANQITLGFELKWHIDELYLYKSEYKTLQDIANIAEDFTRPYEQGDSLMPKLCAVTLPSISEIGYITEAQISYSGAITSNNPYNDAKNESLNNLENNDSKVDYQYSTLTISFQLLIVKDIKLSSTSKAQADAKEAAADADTARTALNTFGKEAAMGNKNAQTSLAQMDFDRNQSVLPEEPKSAEKTFSTAQSAYEATISSQPAYSSPSVSELYGTETPVNGQGR